MFLTGFGVLDAEGEEDGYEGEEGEGGNEETCDR